MHVLDGEGALVMVMTQRSFVDVAVRVEADDERVGLFVDGGAELCCCRPRTVGWAPLFRTLLLDDDIFSSALRCRSMSI